MWNFLKLTLKQIYTNHVFDVLLVLQKCISKPFDGSLKWIAGFPFVAFSTNVGHRTKKETEMKTITLFDKSIELSLFANNVCSLLSKNIGLTLIGWNCQTLWTISYEFYLVYANLDKVVSGARAACESFRFWGHLKSEYFQNKRV